MIGRRKFMQAFGVGALSARKVAEEAAKELTALSGGYNPAPLSVAPPDYPVVQTLWSPPAAAGNQGAMDMVRDYIRTSGRIPEHVERLLRHQTRTIYHLDVDIASKRSWSLAYKITVQRQRNYEILLAERLNQNWYQEAQTAFQKLTGFHWPWWQ